MSSFHSEVSIRTKIKSSTLPMKLEFNAKWDSTGTGISSVFSGKGGISIDDFNSERCSNLEDLARDGGA